MKRYKKKKSDGEKTPSRRGKPDLVKKLDKVFSLYIRLRDAMPSGYVRCISCGQIKPFADVDCGHFHSRTHMATRFDEENCNAECRYCLTPDALILTADLRWVKLGELKEGDFIFAFDEYRPNNSQARYWKKGIVTHIHREIQDVYEVQLENGDTIKTTAEHQWLARKRTRLGYDWVMTKELYVNGYNIQGHKKTGPHTEHTSSVVCKPFEVVRYENSADSGWLAGMIDADGHISQQTIRDKDGSIRYGFRIGVAQCDKYPDIQKRIIRLIEHFTKNNRPCRQAMDKGSNNPLNSNYSSWQFLVTGTNVEKLHFLMRVRPLKMSKVDVDKIGMIRSRYDTKVTGIRHLGKMEIVVMETSTHTFIANGYAMHNCNRFSADHLIAYEKNLITKIGQNRVNLLNVRAHSTKHYLDCELEAMIEHYKMEVKKLSSLKGIRVNL